MTRPTESSTARSRNWWPCGSYVHDGSEGMIEPEDIVEYVRHLELCVSIRSDVAPMLAERVYALENALYECVRLSGADTSGRPREWAGWREKAGEWAVEEVGQLRKDYDEALKEIG